ncbi:MAG TPA: pyridoxal phosphate-dependent aminotransferase [Candidatus Solibacter sp.]|jgi:aspartate aminotransferase|nr:pyridoxal phosphate-dependent aminotransferase [Candidatus Solibacter sp.]
MSSAAAIGSAKMGEIAIINGNDHDISVSMVAQLLEAGEALHGSALDVYLQNYPQCFWKEPILPSTDVAVEMRNSQYSDVLGLNSLRKALAGRDAAIRSQPFLSSDNVAVTQGGTHAINTLLLTFGGPHAEVVIPVPSYSGYRDICKVLKLQYRPYGMDDSGAWLTEELLASLGPSSIMIVNTPHNPSGGQIQTSQLKRLAEAARRSGATIIFDCVYDELVYEGAPPEWKAVFKSAADLGSFIWINSFSKNYGLPGVRLGWITASETTIKRIEPIIESSILCLPDFIQRWAALALGRMSGTLASEMKARRDYLCSRLSGVAGLEFKRPAAGITMMARLRNGTGMDLVQRLLKSHATLFLPGSAYYGGDPQTIRLCFGYPQSDIDKYTSVLASALGRRLRVFSGVQPAAQRRPFASI